MRVLLFTGDGKGKTTAALGLALRAAGHGLRVAVLQFCKSDAAVGEVGALQRLGVTVEQTGRGFIPKPNTPQFTEHCTSARKGLARLRELLASKPDVLVLDEICVAVAKGLLDESEVLEALRQAHENAVLVLTGRGATPGLIDFADTVTEMTCIKHGYRAGIAAQQGVEF